MNVQRILFPRDFSTSSEYALPFALDLARRYDVELHMLLVDVLRDDPFDPPQRPANLLQKLKERAKRMTERSENRAYDPSNVRLKPVVRAGAAAGDAIVEYADEAEVDLIVLGTHARRGPRHVVLGSVAEELVRRACCPVLAVPEGSGMVGASAVDRVLAPVDFSRHSAVALRHAEAVAAFLGVRLDLLHVIDEGLHPVVYDAGFFSIYRKEADLQKRGRGALEQYYYHHALIGGEQVRFIISDGNVADEILRVSGGPEKTLLVMATHGHTGLTHYLVGSKTEEVLRRAQRPVLAVKSFGKHLVDTEPILRQTEA